MADGKIQTPFSEITSPGGLKCQEFGGRRGFEERQLPGQQHRRIKVTLLNGHWVRTVPHGNGTEIGI